MPGGFGLNRETAARADRLITVLERLATAVEESNARAADVMSYTGRGVTHGSGGGGGGGGGRAVTFNGPGVPGAGGGGGGGQSVTFGRGPEVPGGAGGGGGCGYPGCTQSLLIQHTHPYGNK